MQYASLQHAIAKECGLDVGIFTHLVQDLHLYNKHQQQAEELIKRYIKLESYDLPTLKIADKPFFELEASDFELIGYENHGGIGRIEVSV